MLKRLLMGLAVLLVCAVGLVFASGRGCFGRHEGPGEVTEVPRPSAVVSERTVDVASAAETIGVEKPKQILFGDFHVHTTVSFDAFISSLPMSQGEGAHPQADACDFARYCSALDFWSITDHAEGLTARNWEETLESMRQCNQVAADPKNPDTVAFVGWEWTQVGTTPEDHYGHKNVILGHTEDELVPARPIAARSTLERLRRGMPQPSLGLGLLTLLGQGSALSRLRHLHRRAQRPRGVRARRPRPRPARETAWTARGLLASSSGSSTSGATMRS